MIFDDPPADWRDLQRKVHQAFSEMGCHAEERKTIALVRGKKEIDVYVEDVSHGLAAIYLIECKYWESDIPQDVVHGFRTVVTDSGANKGIIIAKNGFQSGARSARERTPVDLLSWTQFNSLYFDKWMAAATQSIQERAQVLSDFRVSPYGQMCGEEPRIPRTGDERTQWRNYVSGYFEFLVLAGRNILGELTRGPVRIVRPCVLGDVSMHDAEWEIKSYREWYDFISPVLDHWLAKIAEWRREFAAGADGNISNG